MVVDAFRNEWIVRFDREVRADSGYPPATLVAWRFNIPGGSYGDCTLGALDFTVDRGPHFQVFAMEPKST